MGRLMTTTFAYKVRDQSGKLIEGQLDAEDATVVVGKLRQMATHRSRSNPRTQAN